MKPELVGCVSVARPLWKINMDGLPTVDGLPPCPCSHPWGWEAAQQSPRLTSSSGWVSACRRWVPGRAVQAMRTSLLATFLPAMACTRLCMPRLAITPLPWLLHLLGRLRRPPGALVPLSCLR